MSSNTGRTVARLGIAIGGALLASLIPGAGPFLIGLGFTLGSVAGNLLFPAIGQNQTVEGPRLGDLQVTSSAPGRPIPILYGTMRMGGNLIWSPGITEVRTDTTIEQGKGGGGSSLTQTSYSYFADFAIGFCEGAANIIQLFADGKLIFDITGAGPALSAPMVNPGGDITISGLGILAYPDALNIGEITLYTGTETQEPSPIIQIDKGVADTPAYRGLCYAVFNDLPLADYGNRIPQITAVITANGTDAFPLATLADATDLQFTVWGENRQILYSFFPTLTENLLVIHAPTQTILFLGNIEVDAKFGSAQKLPGIDNENNLYMSWNEDTDATVIKHDGETFAILGETAVTFAGSDSTGSVPKNIWGVVMGKAPSLQRFVLLSSIDSPTDIITIVDTTPLAGTDNGRGHPILPILNTIELDVLYGGSWANRAATVDDDGFCWVLAVDSADARVTKLNSTTGDPLESHVITGNVNARHIAYDSTTNSLLIGATVDKNVIRWGIDSQSVEATSAALSVYSVTLNYAAFGAGPVGGSFWLGNSVSDFVELDVVDLTIKRTLSNSSWSLPTAAEGLLYDPINHAVIRAATGASTDIYWLFLDRMSGAGVTLQSIVEDISSEVGLSGSDVDASELTDIVHGYAVSNRMPARRAIEPLMSAFFFDGVESDWVAKFPKRGQSAVAALTEDDLGARTDASGIVPLITETRIQEVELPLQIEVSYADSTIDYQLNTQVAQRTAEAVDTVKKIAIELPIAFADNNEPAQIAEKMLYQAWQGRTNYSISVGVKHSRLDPTDVITATADGTVHTILLDEPSFGANGVTEARGIAEDVAVYVSQAVGQDAEGAPSQTIVVAGAFAFQLLDTPLLRDQDDGQIFYMAAGAYGADTFPGVAVYRSADNVEFADAAAFIGSSTSIGVTTTQLATGTYTVFDRANTVTVRLFSGTLSSSTETAIVGDESVNAILIGDELLQFVTATLNADGTYTLSTLLRGRRGTDWAVGNHATTERVVVPATTLIRYSADITDLDVTRYYRGIPIGGSALNAANRTLTWAGRSLKPYAPVHITGSRDFSPTEWLIQWQRRTRVAGAWKDHVDVPLGETSEDYEIDILDAPGSPQTDVVRTITATISAGGSSIDVANLQATYSDADQITDFGALQSSIEINVYQLGSVIGRGFAGNATLTL